MTPGTHRYEPEENMHFRQGYQEGYERGKREALEELKDAMQKIKKLELYKTYTATFTPKDI